MSKQARNILIVVVIILLLFAVLFAVYSHFKSEPINTNIAKQNVIGDANTGLENMLNDILDEANSLNEQNNEEGNTEVTNNETNNSLNSSTAQTNKNSENIDSDNQMTSKEKKAIELVQEKWKSEMGDLKGVSFNVSLQNDGKYGVTVCNTSTTQTIQFYIVDVDTEIIRER